VTCSVLFLSHCHLLTSVNSSESFAAVSIAKAISEALLKDKSASESSRFWMSSLLNLQTKRSCKESFKFVPNSQYSENFFSEAKNQLMLSPSTFLLL
jgi:hypothetical protein